jgi:hypothetical protein
MEKRRALLEAEIIRKPICRIAHRQNERCAHARRKARRDREPSNAHPERFLAPPSSGARSCYFICSVTTGSREPTDTASSAVRFRAVVCASPAIVTPLSTVESASYASCQTG